MLQIKVPLNPEGWDEEKQEFVPPKEQVLQLEHSLVSLSKWESKWHKPYLSSKNLTLEESLDYVRCMTLTKNVDPSVYNSLTRDNIKQIGDYIHDPMTATTINELTNSKPNNKILTAEVIYSYMIAYGIWLECEKWHLNRLIMLIRVCNIENQPPKKMSKNEILRQQAELNAARRKQFKTKG